MGKKLATLKANMKEAERRINNAPTYEEAMKRFQEWKLASKRYTDFLISLDHDNPYFDCE